MFAKEINVLITCFLLILAATMAIVFLYESESTELVVHRLLFGFELMMTAIIFHVLKHGSK